MLVKVASMSQEVSFEDGSTTNFIALELPSGHTIRAVVTDASVKVLVENYAAQHTGSPPPPREQEEDEEEAHRPIERASLPKERTEDGAYVFGGDDEEGEDEDAAPSWVQDPSVAMPPVAVQPPPPPPALAQAPEQQTVYVNAEQQARAYQQQKKTRTQAYKQNPLGTQNGRTVAKDANGYPVLRTGGTDVSSVVGSVPGGAVDDDGVGSI